MFLMKFYDDIFWRYFLFKFFDNIFDGFQICFNFSKIWIKVPSILELVSKELNHLAAILHVYVGGLIFMK